MGHNSAFPGIPTCCEKPSQYSKVRSSLAQWERKLLLGSCHRAFLAAMSVRMYACMCVYIYIFLFLRTHNINVYVYHIYSFLSKRGSRYTYESKAGSLVHCHAESFERVQLHTAMGFATCRCSPKLQAEKLQPPETLEYTSTASPKPTPSCKP